MNLGTEKLKLTYLKVVSTDCLRHLKFRLWRRVYVNGTPCILKFWLFDRPQVAFRSMLSDAACPEVSISNQAISFKNFFVYVQHNGRLLCATTLYLESTDIFRCSLGSNQFYAISSDLLMGCNFIHKSDVFWREDIWKDETWNNTPPFGFHEGYTPEE